MWKPYFLSDALYVRVRAKACSGQNKNSYIRSLDFSVRPEMWAPPQ